MSDLDPKSLQPTPPAQATTAEEQTAHTATSKPLHTGPPDRIFVCCDGTGNEFATRDSKNSNSNVVKLYTALELDESQYAYYHPGVGTMGDPSKEGVARAFSVVRGLAFGYGFRDNVLDAYRYLMQHYAAGMKVYIFGFSRGAYTARALAGLLHGYGLLCRGNEGHIPYAWRMYTEKLATQNEINGHTVATDTTFRDTFSHLDFSIHFVGLWDTVSSVGWVSEPLRLLDLAQNPTIQRGRHAVSIDERRCFFQDNLWGPPVPVTIPLPAPGHPPLTGIPATQDILQVWFTGVHSDVGGSYLQTESGLANVTLKWMIDEIRSTGALFNEERVRMVLGMPAPLEPTPATAALAQLYERPKSFALHRSLHGIWWLLEFLPHRYYDKDDSTVKRRIPFGAFRKIPTGALVHPSVLDRFETHPCYKPRNLTREELFPAPSTAPANQQGYLKFEPAHCREFKLRQNPIFVFVIAVLQASVGVYALSWLGRRLYPHIHPIKWTIFLWSAWLRLETIVMGRWFNKMGRLEHFLWLLLVVLVIIGVGRLITFARTHRP